MYKLIKVLNLNANKIQYVIQIKINNFTPLKIRIMRTIHLDLIIKAIIAPPDKK